MPIVFVHGVNNREGDVYRDNENGRNGFLREIVAPALELPSDELYLASPYWGAHAAQFAWNMAVLPDASTRFEQFGADDDAAATRETVELVAMSPVTGNLLEHARRNFPGFVDLIYGATLAGARSEREARQIAASYLLAASYAAANPKPSWLDDVSERNFADVLNKHIHEGPESFGAGEVLDHLKEGFSRLSDAIPRAGTELLARMGRKKLNSTVTRFTGDVFTYLVNRGTPDSPGPIVTIVLSELQKASAARTAQDNKLIVIAHSFGGEIVYDILTRFDPSISVDVLITVGSQVGLFEEMKLYLASSTQIPSNPPQEKVPKPANLKRWLNVFDPNDILSYLVAPIFTDAVDVEYDTGYNSVQAHGGYFLRPSFYTRLAARLRTPDIP
ncbi:hypothetical protein [Paraburkholderia sp. RL17-337-BIB-A]|uniref:hypothetical protein n=1 Tax=Paraburkholderia sp. RL17-337-BIB-A TaxID=3031636 RepID=UPI0038BC9EE3